MGNRAEPVRRASEIEEVTNLYLIHPLAGLLVPVFAALRIPPNAVSLAGMACGILAGAAYTQYQDTRWAIAGFVLMIAWHVMDGADGQLARLTHAQSELGKVLDGICDYVTFIAVYVGLAWTLSRQHGPWVWALVAGAGLCHAVHAATYELQRQEYNYWGLGRTSAGLPGLPSRRPRAAAAGSWLRRLPALIDRVYGQAQCLLAGATIEFHQRFAALLAAQPDRAEALRQRYRETFAPTVRRWSVMSANYRTLSLFVCAAAKAPLFYFAFEIAGFSLVLAALLAAQRGRYALFFEGLGVPAEQRTPAGAPGEKDSLTVR